MLDTNIGDPAFIRTGTREEMQRLQRRLTGAYNTIDVRPIGYTDMYLLVAQNIYPAEAFIRKMRRD